ncbi:MAG: PrsW family intramembrane metalloprotease [archaeon]
MTPRRILRIARWEVSNAVGSVDRRAAIGFVVVGLLIGGLAPALMTAGPTPGAGIYQVGVSDGSPYTEPVEEDPRLSAVSLDDAESATDLDVVIQGQTVFVSETNSGRAAAAALTESIATYNDRLMATESDRAAAFPVAVTLRYSSQEGVGSVAANLAGDEGDGSAGSSTSEGGATDSDPDSSTSDSSRDPTTGDTGTGEGREDETATPSASEIDDTDGARASGIFGGSQTGTPSSITPPFPLRSLLLAFVFVLPFNVIIQAYGGSILGERINRRGEPLLVSPATRGDIVLGKTLPYLGTAVGITAVITLAVGGGIRSVAAMAPLAALFLAATFVAGMLVRSYKELTFVTVTISVGLTAYAFVPAVFTEVHPIAAISPLSVVVNDLQGNPVAAGEFVLATAPVGLAAMVLFVLGTGTYREEDMFTRKPLPAKVVDAIASPLESAAAVGLWTALYLPFVFVAELFAVAVLFVFPTDVSIPVLLIVLATVEEVAKSGHVLAGFERGRFSRSLRTGATLGVVSGIGFFLAEKVMAITQLVGLPSLEIGRAAFAPAVAGVSPVLLLLAPLALHTTTAAISAVGAARSRRAYGIALPVAIGLHVAYNYAVVTAIA